MKKGFTLIELLAVIVILAIIALIATPIILNIIESTKTSATTRSAELYLNAVEQAVARKNLTEVFKPETCTIESNGNLTCNGTSVTVETTGDRPTSGTITLEDGKITGVQDMTLGGYVLEMDSKGSIVIKGTSSKEDEDDDKGEGSKQGSGYLKELSYDRNSSVSSQEINTFYGTKVSKDKVEKIVVTNTKVVPENAYDSLDVSANQDGSVMAWYVDDNSNSLYELYIGGKEGVKASPNSSSLFSEFENATSIDLTYLDTKASNSMSWMFYDCHALTTLNLGSNFDTSSVTNMSEMFGGCHELTTLELGDKFNTSSVTNMSEMFFGCWELTNLKLGNSFDTGKVADMSKMFAACYKLATLKFGNKFDTSSVTNMSEMFGGCYELTTLELGDKFYTSKVTDMALMFNACGALTTLDLRNADFVSVTSYFGMFGISEYSLNTIYVKDEAAKTFINNRLQDNNIKNVNVTIAL